MTNPNESNELIETIKEVRESLYKVSGSALLAGEKCKSEDKAIIYGLVCNANNLLLSVIDNLAAQQTVRGALKILDRALIEPLSAATENDDIWPNGATIKLRHDATQAIGWAKRDESGSIVSILSNIRLDLAQWEIVEERKSEVLGKTCIDGGACHHACKEKCFRREACAPFSDYSGPWKYEAATGGQESEAQAVAKVTVGNADHGPFRFEETPYGFDRLPDGETYLFASPPSALAIETAALRKAAELVSGNYGWKYGGGSGEYCDDFGDAVLDLIPQDGITELERFGMRVAQEVCKGDLQDGDIRTIVISLIGENK